MTRRGYAFVLACVVGLACRPGASPSVAPESERPSEPGAPTDAAAAVAVLEPSPFLEVLRLERLAAEGRLEREASKAGPVPVAPPDEPSESSDEEANELSALVAAGIIDETDDPGEDEEVRTVVVRSSPFATYEDVFRYGLRAMDKTPRTFNPTRALARLEGPVRVRRAGGAQPSAVRAYVRRLIRERRPAIKACLAEHLRRDPRVLLDEPSGLVFEQALSFGDGVYRFSLDLGVEGGSLRAEVAEHPDTPADARTCECLAAALAGTTLSPPPAEGLVDARAPLVVFVHKAVSVEDPTMAKGLAMQAATMGWIHYERGEFLEARESFRDAAWAYHLPEFQALVGRAEEALGRPRHAIAAYERYVDERPDAPDTAALSARIEALRSGMDG